MPNTTIEAIELRKEDYGSNQHKFYRAFIYGGYGFIQWGRIGTRGQTALRAATAARVQITKKVNEGYQDVTGWQKFSFPASVNGHNPDTTAIISQFEQHVGSNVKHTVAAVEKSQSQQIDDLKQTLLGLRGKLKTEKAAPAAEPVDPDSIESRLGAALAKAKSA